MPRRTQPQAFGVDWSRMPRGLAYGGDYNPEQWPEELWAEDAQLMVAAGVNLVSVAIFAWALLEPEEGRYEFDWLDRVLDTLHRRQVRVCLATATASPPTWFARRYPQSLPVNIDGLSLGAGGRQHYCPNSPEFRQAAANLAQRIGARYQSHPAVAMWHINNEYGCHISQCYCSRCAEGFRGWVKRRYRTLDRLNDAWGTTFWSQYLQSWDDVDLPRLVPALPNPGKQLDYRRFMSDSLNELCRLEVAAVRASGSRLPVTSNNLGFIPSLDYRDMAQGLDICALDSYPDPVDAAAGARSGAMAYDLYRSIRGGQAFMLMEQVSSQVNWRGLNALKQPGQMRSWSLSAVARGADAVMFFQWRASRSGAEKFHGGMVPHVGPTSSRVHDEIRALGADLKALRHVAGGRVNARVAFLFSWSNWWALELESKPRKFDLLELLDSVYRPFYEANIAVDFVHPDTDLRGYSLVVAPFLYQITATQGKRLTNYVRRGGYLVSTFFSGITDDSERIWLGGYPGPLREILGLTVEEWEPIPTGLTRQLALTDQGEGAATYFADILHLEGATAWATYTDGPFTAGRAAVTQHAFGRGRSWHIGTQLDAECMARLMRAVCGAAAVAPPWQAPAGVEVIERVNSSGRYLFFLNQSAEPRELCLDGLKGRDVLGKRKVRPGEILAGFAVLVVKRDGAL